VRKSDDRGSELIELALVLPLLLIAFAAIVDFGFLFQRYEVLTNAAREGARVGVLPGYSQTDITDRVDDYLAASGLTGPTTTTVTYGTQTLSSGATVDVVTVLVTMNSPFTIIGSIAGMATRSSTSWGSIQLRAASTMRRE